MAREQDEQRLKQSIFAILTLLHSAGHSLVLEWSQDKQQAVFSSDRPLYQGLSGGQIESLQFLLSQVGAKLDSKTPNKIHFDWGAQSSKSLVQETMKAFFASLGASTAPPSSSSHWQSSPSGEQAWQRVTDRAFQLASYFLGVAYQSAVLQKVKLESIFEQQVLPQLAREFGQFTSEQLSYVRRVLNADKRMTRIHMLLDKLNQGLHANQVDPVIMNTLQENGAAFMEGRRAVANQPPPQTSTPAATQGTGPAYGLLITFDLDDPQQMQQMGAANYQPGRLQASQVAGIVQTLLSRSPPPGGQVAVTYAANGITAQNGIVAGRYDPQGASERERAENQRTHAGGIAIPIANQAQLPKGMLLAGIPTCTVGGNSPPPTKADLDKALNQLYVNLAMGHHVVIPTKGAELAGAFGGLNAPQFCQPVHPSFGYGQQSPRAYLNEAFKALKAFAEGFQHQPAAALAHLQQSNPAAYQAFEQGRQLRQQPVGNAQESSGPTRPRL